MELWMKIGTAALLVAMLIYLIPRARAMIKASPEGTRSDWINALIPIGLVLLFVLVLVKLV